MIISTHFKGETANHAINSTYDYCIATNTNGYTWIRYNNFNTIQQMKDYLAEQYENGTPVIVEYELEQEEIVPYTPTQQEQFEHFKNLKTYKDMTIISSSSEELPPILTIQYWKEKGTEDNFQISYVNNEENPNIIEFIEDDTLIPEDSINLDEIENDKSFLDFVEEIGDIEESEENENESD